MRAWQDRWSPAKFSVQCKRNKLINTNSPASESCLAGLLVQYEFMVLGNLKNCQLVISLWWNTGQICLNKIMFFLLFFLLFRPTNFFFNEWDAHSVHILKFTLVYVLIVAILLNEALVGTAANDLFLSYLQHLLASQVCMMHFWLCIIYFTLCL